MMCDCVWCDSIEFKVLNLSAGKEEREDRLKIDNCPSRSPQIC